MKQNQDHHSVAHALYQLEFYFASLNLSFRAKDLYRKAYQELRGARYQDAWLDHLAEDPNVRAALEEPFTTHTIVETLMRTGHEPLIRVLIEWMQESQIGFSLAYILKARKRSQ